MGLTQKGVIRMAEATDKQIIALKRFAKNPNLKEILQGKQFDELSKDEASELIKECIEEVNA